MTPRKIETPAPQRARVFLRGLLDSQGGRILISHGPGVSFTVTLQPRRGCRWRYDGSHALVETHAGTGPETLWASLYSKAVAGIERCPPDCECRR